LLYRFGQKANLICGGWRIDDEGIAAKRRKKRKRAYGCVPFALFRGNSFAKRKIDLEKLRWGGQRYGRRCELQPG
jgi:hypothetical protein